MSGALSPGLVHSLAIRRQRALLDEVAAEVGAKIAYLKAAWADPVLYGGRGERTGIDVDVLIDPIRFEAFAAVLERRGFSRQRHPRHPVSAYEGKDWTFDAPKGFVPVDLHRALAVPPWFDLSAEGPLDRSLAYDSIDGPIVSLCPEDQVVFLAAHCATHVFDLDERHLGDIVRLLATRSVDWSVVAERAAAAYLRGPLYLCAHALAARGVSVPRSILKPTGLAAVRARVLERFISVPGLEKKAVLPRQAELVVLLPLLSNRTSALPRFFVRYARHRGRDWVAIARDALRGHAAG